MVQIFLDYVVLPIAVMFYMAFSWIDYLVQKVEKRFQHTQCSIGYHSPVERGPHRQSCTKCFKHFDVDLMATNLEQGRIGFTEQTMHLVANGNKDELPWDHDLTEGQDNLLSQAFRTYYVLWIMWHDGMYAFRRDQ